MSMSWWRKFLKQTSINVSDDVVLGDEKVLKLVPALRVEYAKSKARVARWSEEVVLVAEEMRRTVAFLDWKSKWWLKQMSQRTNISADIQSGLEAYAKRQSMQMNKLAYRFAFQWLQVIESSGQAVTWVEEYLGSAGVAAARRAVVKRGGARQIGVPHMEGFVVNDDFDGEDQDVWALEDSD